MNEIASTHAARRQAQSLFLAERDTTRGATGMEVIVLAMVIGTLGIAAAALGGIFAIYASRQD